MSHGDPKALKREIKRALRGVQPDAMPPFKKNTRKTVRGRDQRMAEWPDYAERRQAMTERRQDAIDRLEALHADLDRHWARRGIVVHRVADADEAREAILAILREAGATSLLKSKSMLSEEIAINAFLEKQGIEPVETDLGEYIVQLRDEPPSHITMPGMHLTREDVGRLFRDELGVEYTDDPPTLTRIARRVLREKFLSAEAGMCGVNFAVAQTGHLATVTNEGNGRMVTSLPRTVIALMGYERVTQSLADLAESWQHLARSATAQRATVYLNLLHGPSPGPGGAQNVHVVVVDNGRRRIAADPELREVLRCIRCGACLNVCPVYQQIGGHPYGGVYPGPIGKVLTPALQGVEQAPDHPFASSLCGACEDICPVSIPLPKMLLELRRRSRAARRGPDPEQALWFAFEKTMNSEKSYGRTSALARKGQGLFGGLPMGAWGKTRQGPQLASRSFREQWKRLQKQGGQEHSRAADEEGGDE